MAVELVTADAPYGDNLRFVARDPAGNVVNVPANALRAGVGGGGVPATAIRDAQDDSGDMHLTSYGYEHRDTAGAAQTVNDYPGGLSKFLSDFPEVITAGFTGAQAIQATDKLGGALLIALTERLTRRQGGNVVMPPGYVWSNRSCYKPEAGKGYESHASGATKAVGYRGAGQEMTYWRLASQIGSTIGEPHGFMLAARNRYSTGRGSVGKIEGLTFKGLSLYNGDMGKAPCNTSAFAWGSRCDMTDVSFEDVYRGLDISGDHTKFLRIRMNGCGVALYFTMGNPNLFGDYDIDRMTPDNSKLATIVAGPNTSIPKMTLRNGFAGTAPYIIYKELVGAGTIFVMENTGLFDNLIGESVGLAYLHSGRSFSSDPNAPFGRDGNGNPYKQRDGLSEFDLPNVNNIDIDRNQIGPFNSAFEPKDMTLWDRPRWAWNIGQVFRGMRMRGFLEPALAYNSFTGTVPAGGYLRTNYPGSVYLEGAIGDVADACRARGGQLIGPFGSPYYAIVRVRDTQEMWDGQWLSRRNDEVVKRYTVLTDADGAVVACNGPNDPFMGLVRTPPHNDGTGIYQGMLVQQSGVGTALMQSADVPTGRVQLGSGADAGKFVAWDGTAGTLRGIAYNQGTRTVDGEANVRTCELRFPV